MRHTAFILVMDILLTGAIASQAAAQAPMPMAVPVPVPSLFTTWDLPGGPGTQAGALIVDGGGTPGTAGRAGTVWEVTAFGSRLIRFNPGTVLDAIAGTTATWTSWDIGSVLATGLAITSGEVVFVRTTADLQRLDPSTNLNTRWLDGGGSSQVSLDSSGNVYSALSSGEIERLSPVGAGDAVVTLWPVGSNFGAISGLAVDATNDLVYFADTSTNQIGELDPTANAVRRWTLPVGVIQPQQLVLDPLGQVWTVTGSNHVVRLTVATNQVTVFTIPTPFSFSQGIASDAIGLIAFTETQTNKVGFLLPIGVPSSATPTSASTSSPTTSTLSATPSAEVPSTGTATPLTVLGTAGATAIPFPSAQVSFPSATIAVNLPFIEASTPFASTLPSGIASDVVIPVATFYFSTSGGSTQNRIVRINP